MQIKIIIWQNSFLKLLSANFVCQFILMTHSNFKEGTAEGWPTWNGFQEGNFGLLHRDATLLVVGGDDVLQVKHKAKVKNTYIYSIHSMQSCKSYVSPGTSPTEINRHQLPPCLCTFLSYLLPFIRGHDFYLVSRDQFPQHFGDHDKLWPVWIDFHSEEQPAQVDHVLLGAVVVSTQILRQLLYGGIIESMYHDNSARQKEQKLAEWRKCLVKYLREMESEVCNQVFPRAHIEPELPLKHHQVGYVGLVDLGRKIQFINM